MGISLKKKQTVSLTKEAPSCQKFFAGLGWDPVKQGGGLFGGMFGKKNMPNIDCDASALILGDGIREIVYFGNKKSNDRAVWYPGDNLTGDGDGDDETIHIDTSKLDGRVREIYVGVNIFGAAGRRQHFGLIENAFIRMVDEVSGVELCRFDLSGTEYNNMTGVIMGKLYKEGAEWHFQAFGEGGVVSDVKQMYKNIK